jgi:hypothetical protein
MPKHFAIQPPTTTAAFGTSGPNKFVKELLKKFRQHYCSPIFEPTKKQ